MSISSRRLTILSVSAWVLACMSIRVLMICTGVWYWNQGDSLFQNGKPQQAVVAYRCALQWLPERAGLHHLLGLCLFSSRKYPESAQSLQKCIELEPKRIGDMGNDLSLALYKCGERQEAFWKWQAYKKAGGQHTLDDMMNDLQLSEKWKSQGRPISKEDFVFGISTRTSL